MKLCPLLWLSLGVAVRALAVPSADELRFWEARCERDPADAFSPARLGAAYFEVLRATGAPEWETKSDQTLRRALQLDPGQVPALVSLSALCLRRHGFAEAEKLADQAVRLAPEQSAGHAARGDARLELGRYTEARADFQRASELAPGLAAESRLAQLRFLEGRPDEAFVRLSKALADASASEPPATVAQVRLQLGELRFRTGDLTQAEAFYGQARELLPEHPSVLERLAELRGAQGKFTAARELFEGFVQRTGRPEYCQAVGDLLVATGDAAAAKAWHDRALAGYLRVAETGDSRYDHHLAAFYSDTRRDAAAAVKWARRDLGQRVTVFTQDALAWALHHHGEREEALRFLTLALAWGTQDANLFFHAAMIHLAGGDKAAGQKFLARAAATNPMYRAYHFHR